MNDLPPFLATGVGSLPHTDPDKAVRLVLSGFREIPCWPQLPRRTFLENMYVQVAAGLPGANIEGGKLFVEGGEGVLPEAEAFYERFLSEDTASFAIPEERAAALHRFLEDANGPYPAVKGQVTGPVSFGLMITDRQKKPVFYDPVGRDVLVKHLLRVAQWQGAALLPPSPHPTPRLSPPFPPPSPSSGTTRPSPRWAPPSSPWERKRSSAASTKSSMACRGRCAACTAARTPIGVWSFPRGWDTCPSTPTITPIPSCSIRRR